MHSYLQSGVKREGWVLKNNLRSSQNNHGKERKRKKKLLPDKYFHVFLGLFDREKKMKVMPKMTTLVVFNCHLIGGRLFVVHHFIFGDVAALAYTYIK